jgi:hypothetical protein
MHLTVTAKINKQNSIIGNFVFEKNQAGTQWKTILSPIFITRSVILFFVSARFSLKNKTMIFHSESIIVLPLSTSFMKIRKAKNNFLKDLDNRVSQLRFSGLT